MLSQHFFETFPQLEGVRFSHMWGGVIDTCSRFCVFWGKAMGGRVSYALGYTGLGVAASRFGAEVMLDLIDGRRTRATATEFVRTKPVPFPPEPYSFLISSLSLTLTLTRVLRVWWLGSEPPYPRNPNPNPT